MADKQKTGLSVLAVGIFLLIFSLIADFVGLSTYEGFGKYQICGLIVGVVITIIGIVLRSKRAEPETSEVSTD